MLQKSLTTTTDLHGDDAVIGCARQYKQNNYSEHQIYFDVHYNYFDALEIYQRNIILLFLQLFFQIYRLLWLVITKK